MDRIIDEMADSESVQQELAKEKNKAKQIDETTVPDTLQGAISIQENAAPQLHEAVKPEDVVFSASTRSDAVENLPGLSSIDTTDVGREKIDPANTKWRVTIEGPAQAREPAREQALRRSFIDQAFADKGAMKKAIIQRIRRNLAQPHLGPANTLLDKRFDSFQDMQAAEKLLDDFEQKSISLDDLLAETTIKRDPDQLKVIKLLSIGLLEPHFKGESQNTAWPQRSSTEKTLIRLGEVIGLEIERRQVETGMKNNTLPQEKRRRFEQIFSGYAKTADIPEWFAKRLNKTATRLRGPEQRRPEAITAPSKPEVKTEAREPVEAAPVVAAAAEQPGETKKFIPLEQMTAEKISNFNREALQDLIEQREEEYDNAPQEARQGIADQSIKENLAKRLYVSVGNKLSPDVPYHLHYFQRYLPHLGEDLNPELTKGGLFGAFRRWFAGTKTYGLFSWNRYRQHGNLRFAVAKAMRAVSRDAAYRYHTPEERQLIGLLANRLEVQTLRDAVRQQA